MRWGTGETVALERMHTLTAQELQSMGMTREMAQVWADFYSRVLEQNPANDSARGRARLMQYAVELLGG